MDEFNFADHSHKRFNPLNQSWVLVSPHRAKRPWLGQEEPLTKDVQPAYVKDCFLCPGNKRIGGQINDQYSNTFVFPNDFPAVLESQPAYNQKSLSTGDEDKDTKDKMARLFNAQGVTGFARVICFSPLHNLTMAEMDVTAIKHIILAWIDQTKALSNLKSVNYVQIFENKGSVMGCSNPHPHGQVMNEFNHRYGRRKISPKSQLQSFPLYQTTRISTIHAFCAILLMLR